MMFKSNLGVFINYLKPGMGLLFSQKVPVFRSRNPLSGNIKHSFQEKRVIF